MALQSSSSSSSYDVFLSFRGSDTRHGFTGHLYKALDDRGIHTFIDDEELQSGKEITPTLMKAIHDSKIAIIVLSEDYASSSFCLDELATILDCAQTKGMLVKPVFYKVDPSNVRRHKGSFGESLAKHDERFHHDKLQKWKIALRQVADLSGYHFKQGDGYEYKFIEKIIEHVSKVINPACLHVSDYPVGLESQVKQVRKLLDDGSDDGVHMIGIHGMGGVGKSTLARAVYNDLIIAENFDGSCFLENVREKSSKHGLEHLQSSILSEILGEKHINLTSKQQGISMIQSRLKGKKVLLILDDVDRHEQLQEIVGRPDWFGLGSRIIITTRDKQLLAPHQINRTYKVKKLNEKDALQLLTQKAFKKEKADPTYVEVLHRAVTYASGLPLALEVIGSHLFGKSIKEWESAIKQYKRIPKKEILDILKVSFDALEEEEKSVFLDIACCFKGSEMTEVEHILGAFYDNCMKHHIGVLVEKSLIEVDWRGRVNMHDLIQDMGKRIDQQESPKEAGERMRLWSSKDIIQVLEDNTGTNKIGIICLDCSIYEKEKSIEWNGDAFKNMKNLKVLVIRNCNFSKGPNYLPKSLRVLEWHRYPSNCLPYDFHPNKLVVCKLPDNCFTSLGFHGSRKKFRSLTILNFDDCKFLKEISDVSDLPNLEQLSFNWCEKLITVHHSIGFLSKLKLLSVEGCSNLRRFPPLNLTSLERLQLSYCRRLENFPELSGEMENVQTLDLHRVPIKELPVSFQNLIGLNALHLSDCRNVQLRSSIVMMPRLWRVVVSDCKGWQWVKAEEAKEKMDSTVSSKIHDLNLENCNLYDDFFSTGFTQLAHVRTLRLQGNNFTFLPECIKEFRFLDTLDVSNCEHLQEIRGNPPNLKHFKAAYCICLSSSSTRMLLNQELHDVGGTEFVLPGATIPEWFDQQSRGPSSSFWFRNEFPENVLCFLISPLTKDFKPAVFINGKLIYTGHHPFNSGEIKMKFDHTCMFDLNLAYLFYKLFEVGLEKEWYHVEITFVGAMENENANVKVRATGLHVVRQENSMDNIRFDDPYGKRKLEHDLNSSESQPLIKNHRLFCRLSRWVGPERIRNLLWNAANGTLITNDERRYWHNYMKSSCGRCKEVLEEACLHALRDCPEVAAFWKSVLPVELVATFFNIGDISVWLETSLSFSETGPVFWPTFFGIAVELLWQFRNHHVFYPELPSYHDNICSSRNLGYHVFSRYEDLTRAYASHNMMTTNLYTWWKLPFNKFCLKLNVSGALDPSSGTAACGGIFQGYYSDAFVLGFSVKVEECSIDEAEIWGVYHGMKIARENDFGEIVVELESQKAIDFVLDGCPTPTSTSNHQHNFPLCHELQALTSNTSYLPLRLIPSKWNEAANSIANFGLSMNKPASIFSQCPSFCQPFILNWKIL